MIKINSSTLVCYWKYFQKNHTGETRGDTSKETFFYYSLYSVVALRLSIVKRKDVNHSYGKGRSDLGFPGSSQEAVERGETIGSFLFPGWSFTFDTGKWEPDPKASSR